MRGTPWLTLAATACAVAAYAAPGAFELLSFQREAILSGEWWRLLTGHLTHATGSHLLWSGGAFLLLGGAVERELGLAYAGFLLASAAVVSLGLLGFAPGLTWYCGLSGLDTALFARLAWREGRLAWREGDKLLLAVGLAQAAALAAKIGFEYRTGSAVFAELGDVAPVPAAHLLGVSAAASLELLSTRVRLLEIPDDFLGL